MIAYLNGKLAHKDPGTLIVECNGVGYEVKISLNTYESVGKNENIRIHTHLQVKEDAHILYGFHTESERALFRQLISISGVGGNTAITILSSISPADLSEAIESEDVAQLKKVKGIGAKTASRIILELKGKLNLGEDAGDSPSPTSGIRQEALSALVNLGFPKKDMDKKISELLKDNPGLSVEEIIKTVLKR